MINMKLLFCLLCLSFISHGRQDEPSRDESKIIGGEQSGAWDFPHAAGLEYRRKKKFTFQCITNLIQADWSVTVAHCFRSWVNILQNVRIRVGAYLIEQGGTLHYIQRYYLHPNYSELTKINNIALIMFTKAVDLKFYQTFTPIAGPNFNLWKDQLITIAGWGMSKDQGKIEGHLRKAVVPLITGEECTKLYRPIVTYTKNWSVHSSQVCANATKSAVCTGDAGGPAMFKGKLVGLLAAGHNIYSECKLTMYPTILTRISVFYNWIENVTGLVL